MKPKFLLTDFSFTRSFAIFVLVAQGSLWAAAPSPDLDATKKAYIELQNVLSNETESALSDLLAEIPKAGEKREIAANLLHGFREIQQGTQNNQMGCIREWYTLLKHGTVDWVQGFSTTNNVEWNASTLARVWLNSTDGKIRGFADFINQKGQWKWVPPLDPNASTAPVYSYDLSTPTMAFVTLKRAQNPGYDRIVDSHGVYRTLENILQKSIPIGEYGKVIEKRRKEPNWERPDFSYAQSHLEEEMLPPVNSKQRCRVWRLNEKGKRVSFELFIKEGEEWKWLPDPKSIWYLGPSKEPTTPAPANDSKH